MPNQFCKYLSNGLTVDSSEGTANIRPCCWYQSDSKFNLMHLKEQRQVWNAITDWTDACHLCKTLENAGQQSMRQSSFDWIDDNVDNDCLVAMDINLDTKCNAACIMCNESLSSLWAKEKSKMYKKTLTINQSSIDDTVDQIVNTANLEHLKYVKFFGGEPLFTDTHLKIIQHIPHPENVILHYTTNGSIYPNQATLDAWPKFKTVIFAASLDGVGDQFDYVRWPLPWSKVSENILRLRNNSDVWNVMFRVEFTANFLNSYYYDRVEQWVAENLSTNLYGDPTEINIHHCWGGTWDLTKMPEQIRQAVMQKYHKTHIMHRLVANLPKPDSLDSWREFVNIWDQRRGNSWQTAFPDLVQYL